MSEATPSILSRFGLEKFQAFQEGNVILFEVPDETLLHVVKILKHDHQLPLKTMAATDERAARGVFRIHYVFGVPKENIFLVPFIVVDQYIKAFPSLTSFDHEFAVYEQEVKTFFGLLPMGHPKADRIILHEENFSENIHPLLKEFAWNTKVETPIGKKMPEMQKFEGEGVYEIPVGPVHAGIIEPGHFRFSVLGEEILRLEPRLGYVHKGTEKLFETLSFEKKLELSERISGDSSYHHALAFVQALEAMTQTEVPRRALLLRVVYAELERLANHLNDIAFIMLDTGFSFGGSHGTRLRERIMQWNEKLTGSRFLRGVIVPGGVSRDIDNETAHLFQDDLEILEKDFMEVEEIAKETDSVLNRLRGTGTLDAKVGHDHGAVGVPARATGQEIDARSDFPYAAYQEMQWSIAIEHTGDVYARFRVRIREIHQSFRLLSQALTLLPHCKGDISVVLPMLPPDAHAVGITEGFRGDIVYFIVTDNTGAIARVKVRDPSFLNWQVVPYTVTHDVVPDFPLINKSFNLSYTGNDL